MTRLSGAVLVLLLTLASGGLAAQATQLVITTEPAASSEANQTFTVVVEARDAGNTLDAAYVSNVDVALTTGTGALGGTVQVAAVGGVATFNNLTIDTVGTNKQLTLTSGALNPAVSITFTITADRLIITTQPSNAEANAAIAPAVVVAAQDGNGNTDTTFTGNVAAAVATGTGATGGTTSVAAVAGVATFSNLTVTTVGAKTLDFTSAGLTTATSASFTITADRLIITAQPTTTVAGVAIATITVAAQDGAGNTDTTFTANVTAALTTGTGTLSGTTMVAAAAGVASFSTLSINLIGSNKELTFTATGLTSAISNPFTINPDADDEVRFVQEPTNAQTGVAISPAITVEIIDQFGNRTTSTASVTLNIGANPGSSVLTGGGATAAVAGLATFSTVSLNNAGTGYTLIASSGALTTDTSATFNITATPTPTISVVGTLTAFSTTGVSVPSAQQSYNVSGTNLTANITITPPAHFQISTVGGGGFTPTDPITLVQAGGTVASTQIFVRYNPTNTSTPHTGNITHASTGATTQNQAVSGNIAAPAAAALSAGSGNPGAQNANPGSTRTALVFRVTETGGGTAYTVTSVSVTVATTNNAAGAAVSRIASVSLRRGGTLLGTVTNGGAGWSVVGDNVTVAYTGLSSAVNPATSADFTVSITFTGAAIPSPAPRYVTSVASTGVNGGTAITGTLVSGGQITLAESAPDDPFAEDEDDDDSCDLSTRGGPAWPLALAVALMSVFALVRRRANA